MNKKGLLKVLGITLFLFTILFFIANKTSFGSMTSASIAFLNINESIPDANFFQWEIESSQDFMLSVWIEDIHGNTITISFGPNNDNSWDYEVDEEVDYLMVSFPVNNRIYEPDSFEDMITFFISEDDDSTFELTDETTIKRIQFSGMDFKLYSIKLADNEDFDDPCWEKNASDWNNLNDFRSDGGDVGLDTGIQFYNSYIHVTRVVGLDLGGIRNVPFYPYYYPPGYIGNNFPTGGYGPYSYGYGYPSSGFGPYSGFGYGYPIGGAGGYWQPQYYQPNWIRTDPSTAYNPNPAFGGGIMTFVSWPVGGEWQSPYYQQTGYNPYSFNQPYNYGFGSGIGLGYPGYGLIPYPYGYGSAPYPYY